MVYAPSERRIEPRFELRCAECGYGVSVQIAPESCPMCRGTVWEHLPGRGQGPASPPELDADGPEEHSRA